MVFDKCFIIYNNINITNIKHYKMTNKYYKKGQHLLEIENDELTLAELKLKLEAAIEGHEDEWLIELIEQDIIDRKNEK